MSTLFIYFAVFVGVLIAADALLRVVRDSTAKRRFVNYRLGLIEKDEDRRVVYRQILKERGLDYDEKKTLLQKINGYIAQSGLRFNGPRTILIIVAIFLACLFAALAAGISQLFAALVAAAAAAGICAAIVVRARTKRIRKFLEQLPDALDVIVRSLSAGHPLPISISLVAREMPDPIGSEFGIMTDEMTYGADIDVATRNMATRVGAYELNLLAISLTVQRSAGGNLAEILMNLSDMIRKRTMLKAKIRAISVEGRMTSWFMLGFPFFLYGVVHLIRPDYFDPMWASDHAHIFVGVAIVLMTLGMLILRKLVNFDF
jgi:tight adherence protein B